MPSDNILSEILIIVQDVQVSIANFEQKLNEVNDKLRALNARIDSVVEDGFPRGDLKNHKAWHETKAIASWKRIIIDFLMH